METRILRFLLNLHTLSGLTCLNIPARFQGKVAAVPKAGSGTRLAVSKRHDISTGEKA